MAEAGSPLVPAASDSPEASPRAETSGAELEANRRALGDPFWPARRRTRVVRVGEVEIGGSNPIVVQSMTNTDTMDTEATVAQTAALADAGCEIVRLTAPSIRDAENLEHIQRALTARGVEIPLVADIHFTPNAAMIAANWVQKVRINPGNYADKKKFEVREYDDAAYAREIERVAERFRPLVRRCKENGVAMRIGTNHGSLSDRILNRYGDTPRGMVESALEFLDVCEDEGFRDIVFSMKASNTQVAIQAYRLLAARLEARAPGEASYPFHVGVTEAGDGEDGRIKSGIGIGALLEDGLGDTIRVSLTEDPVREVPVARAIADRAARIVEGQGAVPKGQTDEPVCEAPPVPDPFAMQRRPSERQPWDDLGIGEGGLIRVEMDLAEPLAAPREAAAQLAIELSGLRDVELESLLVDAAAAEDVGSAFEIFTAELESLGHAMPVSLRLGTACLQRLSPEAGEEGALHFSGGRQPARWVLRAGPDTDASLLARWAAAAAERSVPVEWELAAPMRAMPPLVKRLLELPAAETFAFSLAAPGGDGHADGDCESGASVHAYRVLVAALADAAAAGLPGTTPIVLRHRVGRSGSAGVSGAATEKPGRQLVRLASEVQAELSDEVLVDASVRLGSLLCDGLGDAVSIRPGPRIPAAIDLAYRVLQGARQRTTRTEYISCPSCGRTLFDLEEVTARIKGRTDHLKGVKIAVMGCIVNGPGEMADADFGYVGSGVGQVTLYVGQEVVARAVPEAEATDRLVELIREHGQWIEPGSGASGANAMSETANSAKA